MITMTTLGVAPMAAGSPGDVRLALANLGERERALVATVVALVSDPDMEPMLELFMDGRLVIGAEEGEIGLVTAATRHFARG